MKWVKRILLVLVVGFVPLLPHPAARGGGRRGADRLRRGGAGVPVDHDLLHLPGGVAVAGRGWLDPNVDKYVLDEAGEQHGARGPQALGGQLLAGDAAGRSALVIFVSAWAFEAPIFWIFFVVGLASGVQAAVAAAGGVPRPVRDHQPAGVPGARGARTPHRASVPLGRILDITVEEAADRSHAQLRSLRVRVGGPGPGSERDPLRCRHRRSGATSCASRCTRPDAVPVDDRRARARTTARERRRAHPAAVRPDRGGRPAVGAPAGTRCRGCGPSPR